MRSRSVLSTIVSFFFVILAISGFAPSTQAQTAHFAGVESVVASSGLANPHEVAVDTSGNVYIADAGNNRVLKETLTAQGYHQSVVASAGLNNPTGVAVDASGNVFVVDSGNNRILEEQASAGSYTQVVIPISGLSAPLSIAVDAGDNLYITDSGNGRTLKESLIGSNYSQSQIMGIPGPDGIALDTSGNVYVSIPQYNWVYKLTPSGGTYSGTQIGSGLSAPHGVAVDALGFIYVAEDTGEIVTLYPSGGGYYQADFLSTGFTQQTMAADANGNLYFCDPTAGKLLKLAQSGVNLGPSPVGSATKPISLIFSFDSSGSIGGPAVVTQGIAGKDFADAGTGTCTTNGVSHVYQNRDICTANVVFDPQRPGTRVGAVLLTLSSGETIATGFLEGMGTGPEASFVQQAPIPEFFPNVTEILAVAADGFGNLYLSVCAANCSVLKETWDGSIYTQTMIATGFLDPRNIAVDGAGNVYVSDLDAFIIWKLTPQPNGSYTNTWFDSYGAVTGVAADGSGNVYFGRGDGGVKIDFAEGGYISSISVAKSPNVYAYTLAVDAVGNIYMSTLDGVVKLTKSPSGYVQSTLASGAIGVPVAVDREGNVYFSGGNGTGQIYKDTPSGSSYKQTLISNNSLEVLSLAVDGAGNVYFVLTDSTTYAGQSVHKIDFAIPSALHFAATAVGDTSSDSPRTLTIQNSGNAPLSFPIPDTGANPAPPSGFALGASSTCPEVVSDATTPGTLNAGASCDFLISFSPQLATDTSGWMVLTDDSLNAAAPSYATQSIALAVAGVPLTPTISWNTPSSIVYGTALSSAQLNATANVAGTFSYSPNLGTVLGVGSHTLTATFTPADTVAFKTTSTTVALVVTQATPAISWPTPAAITYGTALTSTQLNASCTVAGKLSYSPAAGTVLTAGNQTLKATFTPTDTVDYTIATKTVALTVNKATQTITFVAPSQEYYGVSPIPLTATGGASGNPVTFSIVSGPGSLSGTNNHTLTITGAGTIVVAANQAASTNYLAATQVTQSITALRPVPAALTTPAPGSTLSGTSATFSWIAGGGVSKYEFRLGTTGPGSKDVYNAADVTTTSLSSPLITNIPAYGVTLYARLYSFINGVAQYNDYTYTESGSPVPAALTSPTPGSTLGSSATFNWTSGGGISKYEFRLGTTGVGSKDIYNASDKTTTALSTGVISVPAYGVTVYARIYSFTNTGASQYNDYTYTESGAPVLAVLTSPAPGSRLTGSSATFNWTAGGGVTKYEFRLGTTGPGSSDVYNAAEASTTALTTGVVSNIPLNGATLYARLYSYINGAYQHIDYTYTETLPPAPAVLTSPTPGSTLSGTSTTFTWTPGGSVSYYEFRLGTTGAGSKDVYNAADVTTTALTTGAIPVPAYGVTLYARLYSTINGVTQYNDYTYTESGTPVKAVLTSPTPGTTLTSSSATFSWTAGGGVTKYEFRLGTAGAGSNDVYNSTNASTTALTTGSVTVPTTGATLYARLYSYINGAWQYNDYTYTEQ